MNILVKRFTLRYNGKDYQAGTILQVSEEEGREILSIADGEAEEVTMNTIVNAEPSKRNHNAHEMSEDETPILPSIDPRKNMGKRR